MKRKTKWAGAPWGGLKALLLAHALLSLGCGGSSSSARIEATIEVDQKLMLDSIHLEATAEGKPRLQKDLPVENSPSLKWTIVIPNAKAGLAATLVATGKRGTIEIVTDTAYAQAAPGKTVPVLLRLTAATADGGLDAGGGEGGATDGSSRDSGEIDDAGTNSEDATRDQANDVQCGPLTGVKNCGTCGHDCTALANVNVDAVGIECRAGVCYVPASACAPGFGHCSSRADDGCETNLMDSRNCGACGAACTGGASLCTSGTTGPRCAASCAAPTADVCVATCVDLKSDPKNCGTCGHDCATLPNVKPGVTGVECRSGACFIPPAACTAGFGHCSTRPDDGCETELKTPMNCGQCGRTCAAPTGLCSMTGTAPSCTSSCAAPSPDLCGTKCVDVKSDPSNCGTCNHNCTTLPNLKTGATGIECRAGVCYVPPSACATGRAHCSSQPNDGCEADLSTPAHCGSCALVCSGSTPLCSIQMQPATCLPSCSGSSPDLCGTKCVTRMTDPKNCGACGHDCSLLPNVKPGSVSPAVQCVAGVCMIQPSACVAGFGHCTSDPNAGCETDLTRPQTCGSCTNVCTAPTGLCSTVGGPTMCSSSCTAPNPDLCGASCVDRRTDPTNCGTCGHNCTALPHLKSNSGVQCNATGGCVVPQSACAAGFANCSTGTNDIDGCETATNTNTNCGGCGVPCTLPNAVASCATGVCSVVSCNSGFGDCTSAPGCETAVNTPDRCGSCTTACGGGAPTCSGGACVCTPPRTQQCNNTLCCPAPPAGAFTVCTSGSQCAVQCNTNFHACNGTITPCYSDSDVTHCGPGCLDCRQPNASAACGGTQCANTCVGTTLSCPGTGGKPNCGSWDFESGTTEGWRDGIGADPNSAISGALAASSRHAFGTYSLAVGYDSNSNEGRSNFRIKTHLCSGGHAVSLSSRTIRAQIFLEQTGGAAPSIDGVRGYLATYNGSTTITAGHDFSLVVGQWTTVEATLILADAVTEFEYVVVASEPFIGVVHFDSVQIF